MFETKEYDKNFTPLSIAALLDGTYHFVIPSFQRGYRWERKQVTDLLEDIKQFASDEGANGDSYFLQPVVVKPCQFEGHDSYEVLDGQQRLTTMLLVLKELLNGGYTTNRDKDKYSALLYDIKYLSRPQLDFDSPNASDNIDSYYLYEAKRVIRDWCKGIEDFTDIIRCLFYKDAKRLVKIIWYAIEEKSEDIFSINIFNRLNKGKISLTSSELIKALFIMDYDLRANGDELPAEQLSMEWNEMERKLQNDSFWAFISNDISGVQTRIDLLFDFVTCRGEDDDNDYSYREFQRLYDFSRKQERNNTDDEFESCWANDIRNMSDAWRQVRKSFDRLVAWYEDNLYYHYVGFLVAVGFTPLQIYNYLEGEKRKRRKSEPDYEWTDDDTMISLRKKMMERFMQNNKFIKKDEIDELQYGSELIRRILLLFNVECCRIGNNMRFDFDKYKKEDWDVEHVEAQNDATLQEFDDRMRWLKNVEFILGLEKTQRAEELKNKANDLINEFTESGKVNNEKYRDFYHEINRFYSTESGETNEDADLTTQKKDYLSNLTLLDSSTNREYKDAPFAFKRYKIIETDKTGKHFMPLCTRNLFLKYYTDSNLCSSYLDNMRWNSSDREGYMRAIHDAVDPIFDSVINNKKEEQV